MSLSSEDLDTWQQHLNSLRHLEWGPTPLEPTQLAEWLYLGGETSWSFQWLRERSVSHIVNAASGSVKYRVPADFHVLEIPADDHESYDLFAHWPEVLKFVRTAPSAVLFHCQAGVNRSAALALAIYCLGEQKPLFPSFRHALAHRPRILRNRGFQQQLIRCVHGLGLLFYDGGFEFVKAEVSAYSRSVEVIFEQFAEDGVANLALFRQRLKSLANVAEIDKHWERMGMYRALAACSDGEVVLAERDFTCVEVWFRSDVEAAELFRKLS
jgi:hypothetical protein